MKKLLASLSLALVAVISCVGLVGCKKNNNTSKDEFHPKDAVGKYIVQTYKIIENGVEQKYEWSEIFENTYIQLNQDGTTTTNLYDNFLEYMNSRTPYKNVTYKSLTSWIYYGEKILMAYDVQYFDANGKNITNDEQFIKDCLMAVNMYTSLTSWRLQDNELSAHVAMGTDEFYITYKKA